MGAPSGLKNDGQQEAFLQRLYDRPFVLLLLGLGVMFAFYTIWGLVELQTLPMSTLP